MPLTHSSALPLPQGRTKHSLRQHLEHAFQVGDWIFLREYLPDHEFYTGSAVRAEITHILTDQDGPWLADGYVALSFKVLELVS